MSDKEVKGNLNVNKDENGASAEQSAEAQAVAADSVKADAEMAKLTADLGELRQTLQRRRKVSRDGRRTLKTTASVSKRSALKILSAPPLA